MDMYVLFEEDFIEYAKRPKMYWKHVKISFKVTRMHCFVWDPLLWNVKNEYVNYVW